MNKKHIILLAEVAFLLMFYGINVHNMRTRPRPAQTPEIVTVTPQRTPAPGEFTNDYTKRRAKAAQSILETKLARANFTVSYRYDNVNGYLVYDLINPELNRELIQFVKDNLDTQGQEWNNIVTSIEQIQSAIQKLFTDEDDETVVIIDILNPDNEDEVWLSVANGIAGYDVVNGIDLLNDQS